MIIFLVSPPCLNFSYSLESVILISDLRLKAIFGPYLSMVLSLINCNVPSSSFIHILLSSLILSLCSMHGLVPYVLSGGLSYILYAMHLMVLKGQRTWIYDLAHPLTKKVLSVLYLYTPDSFVP